MKRFAALLLAVLLLACSCCAEELCSVQDEENGLMYYVLEDSNVLLRCCELESGTDTVAMLATGPITALRMSADGLLMTVNGQEMLFDAEKRTVTQPAFDSEGMTVVAGDGYDALLDAAGTLYIRMAGEDEIAKIAENTAAVDTQEGRVYYMLGAFGSFALYSYDVPERITTGHAFYPVAMANALAATEEAVFAVTQDGYIQAYNVENGELAVLSQKNGKPYALTEPRLQVDDGDVLLFDGEEFVTLLEIVIEPEPTPTPAPTPVTYASGMSGDTVKQIQNILRRFGYPAGKADGIFGKNTERAVKLLQFDLGLEETGRVTPSLLAKMEKGMIPEYEEYVALAKGDEGERVLDLQTRLRELGYMTESAKGSFETNTTNAVKRFLAQCGYGEKSAISASQMEYLFSDSCPLCTTYYKLSKGDSSSMVKRLNKRLKDLGYFSGKVGFSYSSATIKAVKLFCTFNGLAEEGKSCSAELQERIFSSDAQPYVKPEPTTAPEPTKEPKPTAAPEPTKEPKPTAAPEPTPEPEPTVAPEPTAEPEPTAVPEPEA